MAAIRECFEESGYLLAKSKNAHDGQLMMIGDHVGSTARKAIHNDEMKFKSWLDEIDAVPDTGNRFCSFWIGDGC